MLSLTSEIGRLRQAIVCNAFQALNVVEPNDLEELLLNDMLDPHLVRREHALFTACLKRIADVLDFRQLLIETAETDRGYEYFRRLLEVSKAMNSVEVIDALLTGYVGQRRIGPPVPNVLYPRDIGAVIRETYFLAAPAKLARIREPILMYGILQFHPIWSIPDSKVVSSNPLATIEGGDVSLLDPKTLIVGASERTDRDGIFARLENFWQAGVEKVIVVLLPKIRSAMHLDSVFSIIDTGEYLVYKPLIDPAPGKDGAEVLVYTKPFAELMPRIEAYPSLLFAIDALGFGVKAISCGGGDGYWIRSRQEQWESGCNALALQPGLIIVYDHCLSTIIELSYAGYRIVTAENFSAPSFPIPKEKTAVTFPGNEISHGQGGAHCLVQPWVRDSAD